MIAAEGPYQPTVIFGDQGWVTKRRPKRTLTPVYKIATVLRGQLDVEVDGSHLQVPEGRVVLIQPRSLSRIDASPDSRIVMVAFVVDPTGLEKEPGQRHFRFAQHHPSQPSPEEIWGLSIPTVLPQEISSDVSDDIRIMARTWWLGQWELYKAHARLRFALERIVTYFHTINAQSEGSHRISITQMNPSGLDVRNPAYPVLVYIHDHLKGIRCLDDLTTITGVSRSQLNRQFRAMTGYAPGEYVRALRIQLAEDLLIERGRSVAEVAFDAGFSSHAVFNQTWKRYHKQSPNAWRRVQRGLVYWWATSKRYEAIPAFFIGIYHCCPPVMSLASIPDIRSKRTAL